MDFSDLGFWTGINDLELLIMENGKKRDKRKLYLILPVVLLPVMALLFFVLDGGKKSALQAQTLVEGSFNTELPDAQFKEKADPENKMGYYLRSPEPQDTTVEKDHISERLGFDPLELDTDTQAQEIDRKLEILHREMDRPDERLVAAPITTPVPKNLSFREDVDRLEQLMRTANGTDTVVDPETVQLNAMLQRILDIQHPEQVRGRMVETDLGSKRPDSLFRAIPAIIAGKQKAVQGATVQLILKDTLRVEGQVIPKGHRVFGACRIINQRLLLDIEHIRLGTSIIPVKLTVYGLDGMEGIYAPEAILTETMNTGSNEVLQGVGLYGLDGSLATQVAGAGLDAAKSVLGKRLRKIKVKLKAGQEVLLRNKLANTR